MDEREWYVTAELDPDQFCRGGHQMLAPARHTSQLSLTINHREECWVVALCDQRKHPNEGTMTHKEREIYAILLQLCR